MDIYEAVKKLVGEVEPVGDTNIDNQRYENLNIMTSLIDSLIEDMHDVSKNKDRDEYSMMKSGKCADDFLRYLKEEIIENGH